MLDKRQARLWVKIVAIVVAGAFVATLVPAALENIQGSQSNGDRPKESPQDRQYSSLAVQLQAQLKANPTSTALLVQLGNMYLDWGAAKQQEEPPDQAAAQSYLTLSAQYYGRALKNEPDDGDARTDRAIALFYTNKVEEAIKEGERVLKTEPEHQNALFNLGIFYAQAGNSPKAREAWQKYLSLVPTGEQADFVRDRLTQLK